MNNLNFFRYIFSDRKDFPYWSVYYAFLILYLLFAHIPAPQLYKQVYSMSTIAIPALIYVMFYSYSFAKYRMRKKFLKKYKNKIEANSLKKKEVEIFSEKYQITPFRTNYWVEINPNVKNDDFRIAKMEDKLIIFGKVYRFGVF